MNDVARNVAVVMFVDACSTSKKKLKASDPALVRELVQAHNGLVANTVGSGGFGSARVVKTLGDGVMVMFDNDAESARDALRLARVATKGSGGVEVGVAIAAGEIVEASHGDRDIQGVPVDIAAHLVRWTQPGQILVDHSVIRLLQPPMQTDHGRVFYRVSLANNDEVNLEGPFMVRPPGLETGNFAEVFELTMGDEEAAGLVDPRSVARVTDVLRSHATPALGRWQLFTQSLAVQTNDWLRSKARFHADFLGLWMVDEVEVFKFLREEASNQLKDVAPDHVAGPLAKKIRGLLKIVATIHSTVKELGEKLRRSLPDTASEDDVGRDFEATFELSLKIQRELDKLLREIVHTRRELFDV